MTYEHKRTLFCPTCGFEITAVRPAGPMQRHIQRCPKTNEMLAIMVGADPSNPNACWVPTVTRGRAKVRGGRRAHIVALEIATGRPLQPGQVVLHRCDTGNCVNPAHLVARTQRENIEDMNLKGRRR